MIVFTITCQNSKTVFVTSSRKEAADRWIELIRDAEENVQGPLFDLIRQWGENSFTIEEWGSAENPAEVRALIKEAQEELGAQTLSNSLSGQQAVSKSKQSADEVKKLLMSLADENEPADDDLEIPVPAQKKASPKTQKAGDSTINFSNRAVEAPVEPKAKRKSDVISAEADEMKKIMTQIELRRRAQRKTAKKPALAKTVKKSPASTLDKTPGKAATKGAANKLPTGKSSSSTKEKRIREGIKLEKERRAAEKQAQIAAEADEMAAIMARLDDRSKTAARLHRRR